MVINKTEDEKRNQIVENINNNSMSVEAGAGAGKTTIIISRIMEQIRKGLVKAENIVVITFTNAAAEDLRGRILDELRRACSMKDQDEGELTNLKEALRDQSKMHISTIHSFCFRLLEEQSFEARIPADVKLLEKKETVELQREFFRNWYRKQKYDELREKEQEFYRGGISEYILNAFLSVCELPEDTDFRYDKALLTGKKLQDYIRDMEKQLNELVDGIVNVTMKESCFSSLSITCIDDVLAAMGANKQGNPETLLSADFNRLYGKIKDFIPINIFKDGILNYNDIDSLMEIYETISDKNKNAIKGIFNRKHPLVGTVAVNDLNEKVLNGLTNRENLKNVLDTYQNALVIDTVLKARDAYREFCKKPENRMTISNDMLLQEALHLVKASEDALDFFRNKFTCIYVDEFQDTDLVQRDLILELCRDKDHPEKLRKNSLFFVGDPKQSIYAFRGADVDVYEDTRNRYIPDEEDEAEVYSLNNNYRTEEEVVKWINNEFKDRDDGKGRFQNILAGGYEEMAAVNNNPKADNVLLGVYTLNYPVWKSEDNFVKDEKERLKKALEDKKGQIIKNIKQAGKDAAAAAEKAEKELIKAEGKKIKDEKERIDEAKDRAKETAMAEAMRAEGLTVLDKKAITDEEQASIDSGADQVRKNCAASDKVYADKQSALDTEADIIVEIVKRLVSSDLKIYKEEKNGQDGQVKKFTLKPIEYKDFLILCRRKADINLYADRLKKSGIPVNLYGALDMENEDVLIRFRQLYHYLAWPGDNMARYGAYEVLIGGRVTADNADECKGLADKLFETTKYMDSVEMLQYLTHHLEIILEPNVNGAKMTRTQARLQQLYEYIASMPFGDKKDVDKYIQEYMESEVDKELSMIKDQNAVRFMNLHKAKGLEGNIVIAAARTYRQSMCANNTYRNMNVVYPTATNGYYKIPSYLNSTDKNGVPISELLKQQEEAEWTRQDYVEVTRAKEALIFMDALASGDRFKNYNFADTQNLLEVKGLSDLKKKVEDIYSGNYSPDNTSDGDKLEYDINEWKVDIGKEKQYHQYRHISPSGLEHNDRNEWNPGEESTDRPVGNIFGTVMHRAFELLVNAIRETDREEVSSIDVSIPVSRAVMESYMEIIYSIDESSRNVREAEIKRYDDYLTGKLKAFIADGEMIDRIKAAKEVYTEMAFSEYADACELYFEESLKETLEKKHLIPDDNEKYWLNGQADLVLINNDGVLETADVIDYKSDKIGGESMENFEKHLHASYDDQQKLYKYIVSRVFNIPIENVSFEYYHMYK
ncbi:MAG: UvrD-helicase domain-containing protein [Lachnospiraceae bacterium]|nr:UvrD-helicase domain-containing protein [Lachnospiraceae bacterium]